MTETPNNNNGSEGNDKGNHPAYQPILDVLPESLHSVILPTLKEWDANVTRKFQEIHTSYEDLKPYKKLAENGIDAEYAEQSIILADQLQRDPGAVLNQINESWNLGYVPAGQAPAQPTSTPSEPESFEDLGIDLEDNADILKHPQVKAMHDALQKIQDDLKNQHEQTEQEREEAEFEEYLNTLESKASENNLPFNRVFVTALMSTGIDGDEAVKQYHQVLAGNTQVTTEQVPNPEQTTTETTDPPVVMGGEGSGGSGTPDGSVNFGSMSKDDLNKTVEQIIAQTQQSE